MRGQKTCWRIRLAGILNVVSDAGMAVGADKGEASITNALLQAFFIQQGGQPKGLVFLWVKMLLSVADQAAQLSLIQLADKNRFLYGEESQIFKRVGKAGAGLGVYDVVADEIALIETHVGLPFESIRLIAMAFDHGGCETVGLALDDRFKL